MGSAEWRMTVEGITIALDAIRANKVRTGLTILGVAVGVFVVVVISAAIHGINTGVAKDIEAAGPTSFFIQRFPINFEACDGSDETCKWRNNPEITLLEIASIGRLPSVLAASAMIGTTAPITYRNKTLPGAPIEARSANWPEVSGGGIDPGRTFSPTENNNGDRVVVINEKMAQELFGELDPIDKQILIKNSQFRVIGIYHDTASFLSGGDRPKAIVPIETARRYLDASPSFLGAIVKPRPSVSRDDAIDQVTALLRETRSLKPSMENNFAIITQDQLFDTYNKIFGMFFFVMIVLSAIGLIVGGVGVIAIMIISVTERTREIGVRKALGATRRIIMWQFLVEAVTLTGVGAIIGLIFGWLVATLIRLLTPVPAEVPAGAIFAALVASAITGVAFGLFPAARAARLDPVEALRYE
jgi:putative ABC transport system permease protein